MPDLYIITGSNGAGKSSIGPDYLPENIQKNSKVFDGDLLYTRKLKELFPSQTKSPKYARKDALQYVIDLFEQQTNEALATNSDYVYEGHLSMTRPGIFQKSLGSRVILYILFFLD